MDKEVILAVISLISAVASGWMLYKTNINKDSVKKESDFLEAERKFREDILKENKTIREKNQELIIKIEALTFEINCLKDKITDLEMKLSQKIDNLKVISSFIKYLPVPAWLKIKKGNEYKIASINAAYSVLFDVSEDFIKSEGTYDHLPDEIKKHFESIQEKIKKAQKGLRSKTCLKFKDSDCNWYLMKFPVIENGEIVAIGGVLIDCGC